MQGSSTTERTPLVQPTYMFESSLTRRYRKRVHHLQCAICLGILGIVAVALLVTVSYNLSEDPDANDNDTQVPVPLPVVPPVEVGPKTNLTLTMVPGKRPTKPALEAVSSIIQPLLNLKWPLKERPSASWTRKPPVEEEIKAAVTKGQEAVKELIKTEETRKPLGPTDPARKAQRASSTSANVKPLAETAYAVEVATKILMNGTSLPARGNVGLGPRLNISLPVPRYCLQSLPPCEPSRYRSLDGTCNNLKEPLRFGASNTPFRRALPANYADGISSPRTGVNNTALPSARDVSVTVHRPSYAHDSSFTVMLAVWGQFLDHDITATALSKGQNNSPLSCCDPTQPHHPQCFPVPLDIEDPFYQDYNLTCMEFVRSAPAMTCHFGPREQLNQASAFIDASTVYGFTEMRSFSLRAGLSGQLKMLQVGPRTLLPPSTDPMDGCNTVEMNAKGRYCFQSGDDRANENLHLTTMHLIWARQHNRLASLLQNNTGWDDETVFQEARKIVGAQMQHITYSEFLPYILGNDMMWALNLSLSVEGYDDMYDPTVDPSIANHFSAAVFRFAHTLLPGLIHSTDSINGTVNYVHLHEMLFNPFTLYLDRGSEIAMKSAMDTLVHTVDPHVTYELSDHLFEDPALVNVSTVPKKPGPCGLDLVSLNIQRGRDHGLPPYPEWREFCGLSRPKNFTDLYAIFDVSSLNRIRMIYKDVNDIDLYTGALAEDPKGRLLGPTLTCLIADQFLRLKIGDRFWYERPDETIGFTLEQLTEIRKTTLAGVICANEGLLEYAQPRVMEAISPTNPLIECKDLPQPSLQPWYPAPESGGKD